MEKSVPHFPVSPPGVRPFSGFLQIKILYLRLILVSRKGSTALQVEDKLSTLNCEAETKALVSLFSGEKERDLNTSLNGVQVRDYLNYF